MIHKQNHYRTLPGGSIDYAHYEARMRLIRSRSAHSAIRQNWGRLKALFARLRNTRLVEPAFATRTQVAQSIPQNVPKLPYRGADNVSPRRTDPAGTCNQATHKALSEDYRAFQPAGYRLR